MLFEGTEKESSVAYVQKLGKKDYFMLGVCQCPSAHLRVKTIRYYALSLYFVPL